MIYFLCVASMLGTVLAIVLLISTNSPEVFVSVPCVLLVFFCTLLTLLLSFTPTDIRSAFLKGLRAELDDDGLARMVLAQARTCALNFGGIGVIIGAIAVLVSLDDPYQIGGGLAVALISMFYALLLSVFLRALELRILRRRLHRQQMQAPEPELAPAPGDLESD